MFKFNIGGTPTLSMVALNDIDTNVWYLAGDQKAVVARNINQMDTFIVFNLDKGYIEVFDGDTTDVIEEYPSLSMVFPSEVVVISLSLEIMGAAK